MDSQAVLLVSRLAQDLCNNFNVRMIVGVVELELPSEIPPDMWDGRPPTRVTLMDPVINVHDPDAAQVLRRVIPLLANALRECHLLLVSPQLPLREPASGSVDRASLAMSIRLEPPSDGDRAAAVVTVELIDGRSEAVMACAVAELPKPE